MLTSLACGLSQAYSTDQLGLRLEPGVKVGGGPPCLLALAQRPVRRRCFTRARACRARPPGLATGLAPGLARVRAAPRWGWPGGT